MITLTIDQLVKMFGSPGPGHMSPIQRFFSCGLTLPAWKVLRHSAADCEKEMAAFIKKRDELQTKYGGTILPNNQGLSFSDKEKATAFAAEWEALLETEISIAGDPIKVNDIQTGSLTPNDYACLKPFFVD